MRLSINLLQGCAKTSGNPKQKFLTVKTYRRPFFFRIYTGKSTRDRNNFEIKNRLFRDSHKLNSHFVDNND